MTPPALLRGREDRPAHLRGARRRHRAFALEEAQAGVVPGQARFRGYQPPDADLASWYRQLLGTVADCELGTGTWRLLEADGWADNQSSRNLLAWSWTADPAAAGADGGQRYLVVVNLSAAPAQGRVRLPWPDLAGRSWRLADVLGDEEFERDGTELASLGLFVDMRPGQCYLFAVR